MLNVRSPPNQQLVHKVQCKLQLQSMVNATRIAVPVTVTLTTSHLIAEPVQSHTYRVVSKGDRLFHNLVVPLKRTSTSGGFQGCKLEQPWFGPNRWEGILVPAPDSTFEPLHEFRINLVFNEGGAVEFAQKFTEQVQKVLTAQELGVDEVLPEYKP